MVKTSEKGILYALQGILLQGLLGLFQAVLTMCASHVAEELPNDFWHGMAGETSTTSEGDTVAPEGETGRLAALHGPLDVDGKTPGWGDPKQGTARVEQMRDLSVRTLFLLPGRSHRRARSRWFHASDLE